ncbi:hypothetical protein MRX96_005896 [Rhipicephalus microplus]
MPAFFGSKAKTGGAKEGQPKGQHFPGQKEAFSPEVVFFLVYCHALCGDPLGCGDVLKHVARFRRAFQCPDNLTTTATSGCTFFGS